MQPEENCYFTLSIFKGNRRTKFGHNTTHCIVIDDVGDGRSAKVPEENVQLPDPSWRLETSPGNEQWGYILETPIVDAWRVDRLLDGLVSAKLVPDGSDPGMKGVTRYVRLPIASNTKAKYMVNGKPFRCRMVEWAPQRLYELPELAAPYDIDVWTEPEAMIALGAIPDDPLARWLGEIGRLHWSRETPCGGQMVQQHAFSCFWVEEHSGRADTGTYYYSPGTFKCWHGHCKQRTQGVWWSEVLRRGGGEALTRVRRAIEAQKREKEEDGVGAADS